MAPPGKRTAPGGESGGPDVRCGADTTSIVLSVDADTQPRCLACERLITSPASIAAGLGRDCRRRMNRGLRDASPTVQRLYREMLEAARGAA